MRSRCAVCLVALALMAMTLVPVSASLPFPPRSSSAPFVSETPGQPPHGHWINVRDPPDLAGSIAVQPAIIGAHPPVSTTINGVPAWEAELVNPHVLDDPKACLAVNATLRRLNELNETFTGKIMLLRRGTCAFGVKAEAAELAGAAGVLIHGCSPDAPTYCSPGLVLLSGTQSIGIPVIYLEHADGILLHDHLAQRMAQRLRWLDPAVAAAAAAANETELEPIILQMPSTGAMDPVERLALQTMMATTTMRQETQLVFGGNRAWNATALADPATDPCLQRMAGLWCEDGHAVELNLQEIAMTGEFPPELGSLTRLRILDLSINQLSGEVPPALCALTQLVALALQQQNSGNLDGFTSLPDCMSTTLTELRVLTVNHNALGALPSLTALTLLNQVDFSNNAIPGALGTDFSGMPALHTVRGGYNALTSVPPGLGGHASLVWLELPANALDQVLSATFDGCASLVHLDLSSNSLRGSLPDLAGCAALENLWLSSNKLASSIPHAWTANIPNLVSFKAASNAIVSPISTLGELLHLQTIDLSHNSLTASTGLALQENDVGALLSGASGPSLANLDLSHNNIKGHWGAGWLDLAQALSVVNLAHNGVTAIPFDLFLSTFTSLDVSHNNVSSWGEANTPEAGFVYLNLLGNPHLSVERLPAWVVVGEQMFTNPGDKFACPALSSTSSVLMKFLVDSSFSHYAGCRCAKGTFGLPPLCHSVPLTATLLPDGSYSSAEVGSEFATVVGQAGSLANVTTVGALERSFSDGWYGDARLTLGLATSWVLDLRSAGSAALPVRHMVVRLHVSRALFSSETDVLTVYEGDGSLSGARVAQLRGTDALPSSSSAYTSSAEYQSQYARQLAALGPQSVLEVLVLTPLATVSFSSRAESGTRFFATYSFATDCPADHFLAVTAQRCVPCVIAEGNFFDAAQQRCRPNLVEYRVSDGIRAAVWATAGLAFVAVLLCAGMVVARWESPIIRAASRSFLLLLLAFLAMWPLGALLYAATPVAGTVAGELVCHARVWLSAFPLSGILAVLLAKTNRVNTIFGSNKLVVRKMTDSDLLGTVATLLAGVSVLLAVFSGMRMARPDLSEGSGAHVNELLRSCANSSAYTPWLGVLLAYIFVLCLGAAFLAWRTRDLPSRFNESGHIMNALLVLLFFGAMIVPLDALIQDNPEAAVLIQGVGQTLLCMLLTAVIFGPKAYLLMVSAPLDQNSVLGGTALHGGAGGNASVLESEALPTGAAVGTNAVNSLSNLKVHTTTGPATGTGAGGGGGGHGVVHSSKVRTSTREAAYLPGQTGAAESKRSSPQMAWRSPPPGSPSTIPLRPGRASLGLQQPPSLLAAGAPRLLSNQPSAAGTGAAATAASADGQHSEDALAPSGSRSNGGSRAASRRGTPPARALQVPAPPVLVHLHANDTLRLPVSALEMGATRTRAGSGESGLAQPSPPSAAGAGANADAASGLVESFSPSSPSSSGKQADQQPQPQAQHQQTSSSSAERLPAQQETEAEVDAAAAARPGAQPSESATADADVDATASPPAATSPTSHSHDASPGITQQQ